MKLPLVATCLLLTATVSAEKYDTIVRHGRLLDGTGATWFYADIGIREGRIARIGNLREATAECDLDASGTIVAPGFIDVHTHADEDLYNLPYAENFVRDGVTTIVTGNCGSSVVDVAEYFATLEERGVAVNVATLIGHNTVLRRAKEGLAGGPMDEEEWQRARALMHNALQAGAIGFSTGLIYTPGTYSTTDEIVELQRVAALYGGIYVTHMRSESTEILKAIDEALHVGRTTGSRVQISHFKLPGDVADRIGGARTTLGRVEAARAQGMEVWVDQYPYTASSTSLSTMLPDELLEKGPDDAKRQLRDEKLLPGILEKMRQNHEVARGRKDLSYAVITSSSAYPELAGRSILEAAQIFALRAQRGDKVEWKAIPRSEWPSVTMEDQYRAIFEIYLKGGAGCVFHTMREKEVEDIMRSPLVAICSDSGVRRFGSGVPHPRGYGSNARVLGRYVRERQIIPVEEAVRKMTSMPALAFRLMDRGLLREGFWADLTIFDPATVTDNATYEDPHHYSTGFRYVLVNGELVVEKDALVPNLPGKPLRGPGYRPELAASSSP